VALRPSLSAGLPLSSNDWVNERSSRFSKAKAVPLLSSINKMYNLLIFKLKNVFKRKAPKVGIPK
jgi:hypothetical protein